MKASLFLCNKDSIGKLVLVRTFSVPTQTLIDGFKKELSLPYISDTWFESIKVCPVHNM